VYSFKEVEALHATLPARTIVHESDFSLWSPFGILPTKEWVALIDSEKRAVDGAFGPSASHEERLQVLLKEVPGLGPRWTIENDAVSFESESGHPLHGVEGMAYADTIVLHVAPQTRSILSDGREFLTYASPASYAATLRHELAHIAAFRAGIQAGFWLNEGLAELVDGLETSPDGLLDRGPKHDYLHLAAGFDPQQRSLERLLEWREDGPAIQAGRVEVDVPARVLCGLYVRHRLGLAGDGAPVRDLARRLLELQAESRAAHLAGEVAWQSWLDRILAAEAPTDSAENAQ
jgi:hypothetical protein